MNQILPEYIEAFRKMNRAVVRGYKAPHKPILLLSILELIIDGKILTNKIELSEELIGKFSYVWMQYVDDGCLRNTMKVADGLELEIVNKYPFKCSIANPYFHMQHEPFWTLVKSEHYVKKGDYSVNMLRKCFECAVIDAKLYELFHDEISQQRIKNVLISLL